MKKILLIVGAVSILLLTSITVSANETVVDAGGSGEYTTIHEAIANASTGDTITIKSGTYEIEDANKLIIDKALTIQGESKDDTHIIQVGYDNLFEITADGVTIKMVKLEGAYSTLISLRANDTTIEDVNFVSGGYSNAFDSSDNLKTGLSIKNVVATGKYSNFHDCSNSAWESSSFSQTSFNTITDSTVTSCIFSGGGIDLNDDTQNLKFQDCTFKDHDNTCFQMKGTMNKLYLCTFQNITGYGNAINLDGSDNEVKGCTFTLNKNGISTFNKNNTIAYNNFVDNIDAGVIASSFWMGEDTINIDNNWWGDATGPYNANLNPDGLGDNASGNVEFTTWLDAESTWTPDDTDEDDTGEDDGGEDDTGDDTGEDDTGEDDGGTPGFELLVLIAAIAVALIILRKRE